MRRHDGNNARHVACDWTNSIPARSALIALAFST
jgi:hypothetical protein